MIKNEANKVEPIVDVNRAQIEHRATWMGLIYDEMVKAGVPDAEAIVRRAIVAENAVIEPGAMVGESAGAIAVVAQNVTVPAGDTVPAGTQREQ